MQGELQAVHLNAAGGKILTPPGGGAPDDSDMDDSDAPSCLAAKSAVIAPFGMGAPLFFGHYNVYLK